MPGHRRCAAPEPTGLTCREHLPVHRSQSRRRAAHRPCRPCPPQMSTGRRSRSRSTCGQHGAGRLSCDHELPRHRAFENGGTGAGKQCGAVIIEKVRDGLIHRVCSEAAPVAREIVRRDRRRNHDRVVALRKLPQRDVVEGRPRREPVLARIPLWRQANPTSETLCRRLRPPPAPSSAAAAPAPATVAADTPAVSAPALSHTNNRFEMPSPVDDRW
jgi:hypothetical protein